MNLTDIQRRILLTTILQANTPESEIARALDIREHTVRRTMMSFFESGILLRRSVFINPHILGLTYNVATISLPLKSQKHQKSFLELLASAEESVAVYELGGETQCELRFLTRNADHRKRFLEHLAERFPHPFHIRSSLVIEEQEYSGISEPEIPKDAIPLLRFGPLPSGTKPIEISEQDHAILSNLANGSFRNLGQLARHLSIAPSTLTYRIQSLEKSGIIVGHYYIADFKALHELPICVRVNSKVLREKEKLAILKFCRAHPRVAWMSLFFGGQSAEIFLRVSSFAEASSIVTEISSHFEGIVDSVAMEPQIQFHKFSTYPFRQYGTLVGSAA
jgi:DNA-binding Lrp family transcriptional regulator